MIFTASSDNDSDSAFRRVNPVTRAFAMNVVLVIATCGSVVSLAGEPEAKRRAEQVQRLISDGKLADAGQLLDIAQQAEPLCERDALALIQLAMAETSSNDLPSALRHSRAAIALLADDLSPENDPAEVGLASRLTPGQRTLVRLSAGNLLVKAGSFLDAYNAMMPLASPVTAAETEPARLSSQQQEMLGQLMLGVGAAALGSGDHETAVSAYATAVAKCSEGSKATAVLGHAWAVGAAGNRPAEAAQMLADFIETYPQHADVSAAAAACVTCLRQSGDVVAADKMAYRILAQWAETTAAHQTSESIVTHSTAELPEAFVIWLEGQIKTNLSALSLRNIAVGIRIVAGDSNDDRWDALVRRLVMTDQDGVVTADVLLTLERENHTAAAERLAATAMVPAVELPVTRGCQEAACRWAGRTRRWTMLALASESDQPAGVAAETPETGLAAEARSVAVERLYAESLMQTGRSREAQNWWNHLVDNRNVNDFATLLRCAETAASHAPVDEAAQRIATARDVAGENSGRVSLVEMLAAELAIRKIQFDDARYSLAKVVRSGEAPSGLRGRAQWMIGETFYMQKQFEQAIDAYRRVEGIDETDTWTAAALVQAGKSFEQLGRTREATVCYFSLVSRFAKSPHAIDAQRRLAAIAPENMSNSETFRR